MSIMSFASLLLLVGVQVGDPGAAQAKQGYPWVTPETAVMTAAEKDRNGYKARFGMTVRATGESRGWLFLNSQDDYRDPRNLSVKLSKRAQYSLQEQLRIDDLDSFFKGKTIVVDGVARATKIRIYDDKRQWTGEHYFQTQIRVDRAGQIGIVEIERP
jgi:hypothetical protein